MTPSSSCLTWLVATSMSLRSRQRSIITFVGRADARRRGASGGVARAGQFLGLTRDRVLIGDCFGQPRRRIGDGPERGCHLEASVPPMMRFSSSPRRRSGPIDLPGHDGRCRAAVHKAAQPGQRREPGATAYRRHEPAPKPVVRRQPPPTVSAALTREARRPEAPGLVRPDCLRPAMRSRAARTVKRVRVRAPVRPRSSSSVLLTVDACEPSPRSSTVAGAPVSGPFAGTLRRRGQGPRLPPAHHSKNQLHWAREYSDAAGDASLVSALNDSIEVGPLDPHTPAHTDRGQRPGIYPIAHRLLVQAQ